MKIRFLTRTESDVPQHPFLWGQVIEIPSLTAQAKRWLSDGNAEVVRSDDTTEVAAVELTERATIGRPPKAR
jgi:hypothetical protein